MSRRGAPEIGALRLDHPVLVGVDRAIERLALGLRGDPRVDRAMYVLSEAANHSALWHGINAVDALRGPGPRRRALRRSVLLVVEQAVVNGPVKSAVGRARPEELAERPHPLRVPRTSSFPSGHASAAACASTLLHRDLGGGPLWWALAAAVAWSRVHVGVHHPSDVVAGWMVGRTLARVCGLLWPPPRR